MKALFLDKKESLSLRDAQLPQELGANDVRIKIANVGICGSDVHYYLHGNIGNFVVKEPMVLGHEASGTICEVGSAVKDLKVGDRVCMEPGIPDYASRQTLQGLYNLDPEVRFWATPPIHGCLREAIVHPASLTFKLPDNVSFEEGALVEPLAIGVHSAKKARIAPGDTALVLGAGTIGLVTALAAVASGCSHVIVADSKQEKLDFIGKHMGAGTRLYLPVRAPGALFALGDLHAVMGDGELCGTGLEICGEVKVRFDLIKNRKLDWPVLETKDDWHVFASSLDYTEALVAATRQMQELMSPAYGWDATDVFFYLSLAGEAAINQGCQPCPVPMVLRVSAPRRPERPLIAK